MLKWCIRALRSIRRNYIADDSVLLPIVRSIWRWIVAYTPSLARKGVSVNIGGYGYFRMHPSLAIGTYNFEKWGTRHNSGFGQWIEACRGKKCVFDIGAHIGLYAMPASKVLEPHGKLYAFEPGQTNRKFFAQHIAYNKISNVAIVSDLVGDEQKQDVEFFETPAVHGMNTVAQESVAHKKSAGEFYKTLKKQICLDDFCKKNDIVPEVVKIDVEGGELGVLQGGREILTSARPLIFLSVHPEHLRHLESSIEELYGLIRELGYKVYGVDGKEVNVLGKEEYILKHDSIKP